MGFKKIYDIPPGAPACGPRKGTSAGAQAHRNMREKACPECAAAWSKYKREQRRARGEVRSTLVPNQILADLLHEASDELREKALRELGLTWPLDSNLTPSSRADFAPRGEATPSALSRDTATAEGVSKLPAPDAGGSS